MMQKLPLFQLLSKRTCSWIALALFGVLVFLLMGSFLKFAPPFSLKMWEFVLALFMSLQMVLSPSVEQLIQSHLPTHIPQRWAVLLEGCLFGLCFLLIALLFSPIWDHVFLVFNGPLLIAFAITTLLMMGFYISGRFS